MQVWLQRTVGCIALSSLVFSFGANLLGLCGTRGCVGSSLGVCKGVALVKRRVSAFAMYRIGLAGPRHCSVMRCGTI